MPEFLIPFPESSVPAGTSDCMNNPRCKTLAYALRCERAWKDIATKNLLLEGRIRDLEALIRGDGLN